MNASAPRSDRKHPEFFKAICEKYNYNIPSVIDVLINRYIKEILKELSKRLKPLLK